jgi:hypothetical protein
MTTALQRATDRNAVLEQRVAERTSALVGAVEALRHSEAWLRLALDATGIGTFIWHITDDRGKPDAQMLALFGLSADSSLSLTTALATMIHPADRAR